MEPLRIILCQAARSVLALIILLTGSCVSYSQEQRPLSYQHKQFKFPTIYTQGEKNHIQEGRGLVLDQRAHLTVHARLRNSEENITKGLVWRVYVPILGADDKLPSVATFEGGSARFNLEEGSYLIHVSFGHVSAVQRVDLEKGQRLVKNFYLDAGGVILDSELLDGTVNAKELRFIVYEDEKENDDTGVILSYVKPRSVVRLKAGHYRIVSQYGSVNAVVRSDIQVNTGQITEVTFQHKAAQIVLKLVYQEGGEALADTSWSITNNSGDIVYETAGAHISLVLAEGDYIAVAKNKDQIYQKSFSVKSGYDKDVSVVADARNVQKSYGLIN